MAGRADVTESIELGQADLNIAGVWRLAYGQAAPAIPKDVLGRVGRSAAHVDNMLARDGVIYGVTTGYGDSVTRGVPAELVPELPLHLSRFHGCGMGRMLSPVDTRAWSST